MPDPRADRWGKILTLRVSVAEHAALQALAAETNTSMGAIVRKALQPEIGHRVERLEHLEQVRKPA